MIHVYKENVKNGENDFVVSYTYSKVNRKRAIAIAKKKAAQNGVIYLVDTPHMKNEMCITPNGLVFKNSKYISR